MGRPLRDFLVKDRNMKCLWGMPGPENTSIERVLRYAGKAGLYILFHYEDRGEELFAPVSNKLEISINRDAVITLEEG